MHFCPGCHHGLVHRLIAEALDYLKVREKTIGVAGVGCGVFLYDYLEIDVCEAPHGRAPAVATGIKRVHPHSVVFSYQGDGDLAAIGTAEIVHAANRGEKITVIFVNNGVYGMTGGQMAPTTLEGQYTTTTPTGRHYAREGYPIRMAELLSTLQGVSFAARVSCHSAAHVRKARKVVRQAFQMQRQGPGLTFVEFLSCCPTNWKLTPQEAVRKLEKDYIPYFPLAVFKGPRDSA